MRFCANYALLFCALPAIIGALRTPAPNIEPMIGGRLLARVQRNDVAGPVAREAVEFVVGGVTLGRMLPQSVEALSAFRDVFTLQDQKLALNDRFDGVSERSRAVSEVLKELRKDDAVPMLRGWRDEAFAVRSTFHSNPSLLIERAAAPLFGSPAYGVFCNGFVSEGGRPAHVWLGKRALDKPTWPGRYDSLAAGGLAAGMLPRAAMIDECSQEAGIPATLADSLRPTSCVSYTAFNEDRWGLKTDRLFVFDLEVPFDFEPVGVDGEVASFERVPVGELVERLAAAEDDAWKPNVGVVMIDFLVRHGFVSADDPAFLPLIDSLRGAECR